MAGPFSTHGEPSIPPPTHTLTHRRSSSSSGGAFTLPSSSFPIPQEKPTGSYNGRGPPQQQSPHPSPQTTPPKPVAAAAAVGPLAAPVAVGSQEAEAEAMAAQAVSLVSNYCQVNTYIHTHVCVV